MRDIDIVYKCRRCGDVFVEVGMITTNDMELIELDDIPILAMHKCEDNARGVADIQGFVYPYSD